MRRTVLTNTHPLLRASRLTKWDMEMKSTGSTRVTKVDNPGLSMSNQEFSIASAILRPFIHCCKGSNLKLSACKARPLLSTYVPLTNVESHPKQAYLRVSSYLFVEQARFYSHLFGLEFTSLPRKANNIVTGERCLSPCQAMRSVDWFLLATEGWGGRQVARAGRCNEWDWNWNCKGSLFVWLACQSLSNQRNSLPGFA